MTSSLTQRIRYRGKIGKFPLSADPIVLARLVLQAEDFGLVEVNWLPGERNDLIQELKCLAAKFTPKTIWENNAFKYKLEYGYFTDEEEACAHFSASSDLESCLYFSKPELSELAALDQELARLTLARWKVARKGHFGNPPESFLPNHWWYSPDQRQHRRVLEGDNPSVIVRRVLDASTETE